MRGRDGRILVEGFYDDVVPLGDADRRHIAEVPFDEEEYKRGLGVDALFGEGGYTPMERAWARPTLELNGIWGAFQGEGAKTVIPSQAHAKITCRLVPNQDLARIVDLMTPPYSPGRSLSLPGRGTYRAGSVSGASIGLSDFIRLAEAYCLFRSLTQNPSYLLSTNSSASDTSFSLSFHIPTPPTYYSDYFILPLISLPT
jgi:hypothetical protein